MNLFIKKVDTSEIINILFFSHLITYWLFSLYFLCKDVLLKPEQDRDYKYCERNGIYFNIDYKLYTKAVYVSLKSQFLILYPLLFIFARFYTFYDLNISDSFNSLILAILLEEILFYSLHRLLHTKWLWKYHSMHHELINTVSVATFYSSWLENLLCNFFPVIITPIFIKMSFPLAIFWTFLSTSSAVLSHCGFKSLKYMSEFHSTHHLYKSYNYGTIGLLDILFLTYKIN